MTSFERHIASMHRTAYLACFGLPVFTKDISNGSRRLQTESPLKPSAKGKSKGHETC